MTALSGGEDYELLFTISPNDFDKIKNHPDFTIIGHAVEKEEGNFMVARGSNQLVALTAQGWDAFWEIKPIKLYLILNIVENRSIFFAVVFVYNQLF
jgi:hypothetical protein